MLVCTLFSCENESVESGELMGVSYKPTQCSEPWDEAKYTDSGKSREERFKLYLANNGITKLSEFKNTPDDKIYCAACNCLSNDLFTFKLSNADYQKFKKLEPFKD
jgi:hypothetical protein